MRDVDLLLRSVMTPTMPPGLTRAQARAKRPVFVDRSGRRIRAARALTVAGVGLILAYVALVVASFFGVPTIVSPLLPHPPGVQAVAPVPTPSTTPPSPRASPPAAEAAPADPPAASTPPSASQTPEPVPAGAPVTAPSPTPTSPGNGQSSSEHGKSATAPGKSRTPTPPAKP
jgi:hypothetical protein